MKKTILLGIITILVLGSSVAFVWNDSGSGLVNGTFNNTLWNGTGEYVYLNYTNWSVNDTFVWNGTYLSVIKDFGDSATFFNMTWEGKPQTCPGNMSYIDKLGGFCIDQYEASMPNANSTHMGNATEIANRNNPGSMPATSKQGVIPWVEVSQTSAITACQNAGKELCTNEQWLAAANIKGQVYNLDTELTQCTVNEATDCDGNSYKGSAPGYGDACDTGSKTNCVSSEDVYDMVGNVREWTNGTVTTVCPGDSAGWYYPSASGDWETGTSADTLKYGNDGVYFAAGTSSGRAVQRGGRWDGGALAGPFCAHLSYAPSYWGSNIGFRCCSVP